MNTLKLKHLLTVEDLSTNDVLTLIEWAEAYKHTQRTLTLNRPVYITNLFFENSTRTHRSFEMAERKLGLDVIQFEASTSSTSKGESLYDTVKTFEAIGCEIAVIRHNQDAYYKDLLSHPSLSISLVNGGDGKGQHPTQCLLDVMTIHEEFKTFKGLRIAIAGDIRNSRVARSNAMLLNRLGATLYFCAPDVWYDHDYDAYGSHVAIDDVLSSLDVLMLLRVQHERHDSTEGFKAEDYHEAYGLTLKRAQRLKPSAIILHPAPVNRNVEIADACVEAMNARIFTQMTNGVYMRMAILEAILRERGCVR